MTVIHVENIVKRYGNHIALDHVDFAINEGEILGLLGPNGAGKTTLIHALTGIIRFDSGRIHVFEKNLVQHLVDIKSQIGLVTQEITIFHDLTAKENLQFFGRIYGLRGATLKERVEATLALVGLAGHASKLPSKFSGGMQRRLNIACALVHQPRLLIMDEPTVGIDAQSRNYILDTIRKLNKQGTTILYTTHYIEEVQSLAKRVVIMDEGHIIADGTVEELVSKIHHEEKIKLEIEDPSETMLKKLRRIEGIKQVGLIGKEVHIISQAGAGNLDRVLAIAREFGKIYSVEAEKPSLEDVFLTLTGKRLRDAEEE
ncbi:ABC transporter ATP-binding protein [Alkalicoccus daliensis]|uniref:ABC-2 type transport system ATP-binding protein n=1 Tax=Alkalicoccus daliensis TaxID=745820 RepID=A0A1H0F7Q5_9BACI|nr:ABC transporter ATP-binding protein [Alkalicoccus daliensis]SDN90582.1 ABC-2 type transport system ATP-binding protein [Alkalicoccus daliensis]